jgi:hypothetical protein
MLEIGVAITMDEKVEGDLSEKSETYDKYDPHPVERSDSGLDGSGGSVGASSNGTILGTVGMEEVSLEEFEAAEEEWVLLSVSESRIKWGSVEMPDDFYRRFAVGANAVGHLSFGVKEDRVREPVNGHIYA